jgi:iron complex outermembrane receptor protein
MEFVGKSGVSQEKADALADMLAGEISQIGNIKVISMNDVLALLNLEKKKRLAGCKDESCVSEIVGAMGVRWMVSGNVGIFGNTYLLNLKLYDTVKVDVASRVSIRVEGGEEDLLNELLKAAHKLIDKAAMKLGLVESVTAPSKHLQRIEMSPSAVTVLTGDQVHRSGAINVPDLLRRVPGFDVYEMKPSFPLVGARALTEYSNNLVLVLVDGREPLVEIAGWPIWAAFTFDLEEIERIEVIRGPGSTLYGANAFAGVVSITTVSDKPSGEDIVISFGEDGLRHVFGRVRQDWKIGGGTLDFSAGVGNLGRLSPSDRENPVLYTDFHTHGYVRYRRGDRLELSLHAGALQGGGPIYMNVGDFRSSDVFNHFEMLQAGIGLGEQMKLKMQVYHSRFVGDFHCRGHVGTLGFWLANVPDFYMDTNSIDGQVQLDFQIAESLLLIGGGNIRYTTNETDKILPNEILELRGAGFLHVQWHPQERLQLTAGLRYDMNNETAEALSPRAVAVFSPWKGHSFRLGYGLAFRKPSFLEYRMHVQVDEAAFVEVVEKCKEAFGNEDLVNEKVHSFELGWRGDFLGRALRASVDLFYNVYVDTIFFNTSIQWSMGRPDITNSVAEYQNKSGEIQAVGGEVEISLNPGGEWAVWGNLGSRWVIDESGDRVVSEPVLRANLGGSWTHNGLFVDMALHYVSEYSMPLVLPHETFEERENVPLGNHWLAIGRFGYSLDAWEDKKIEVGLIMRIPVGGPFRECPGMPMNRTARSIYGSDFVGEKLVRLLSFYLRGSF